jgi:hypothetical protein
LPCFDDDDDVNYSENEKKAIEWMSNFWGKVWTCRNLWGEPKRLQILQKVFDRLESLTLSPFYLPYHKCQANLKMCVKRQPIVFFLAARIKFTASNFILSTLFAMSLEVRKFSWRSIVTIAFTLLSCLIRLPL